MHTDVGVKTKKVHINLAGHRRNNNWFIANNITVIARTVRAL